MKSRKSKGVKLDTELDADDLKALVKQYHDLYKRKRRGLPTGTQGSASGSRQSSFPLLG